MQKEIRSLAIMTVVFIHSAWAQCPTAPANCTYEVNANSNTNYTVGAGQTLCIQSGTYSGSVNVNSSTGTIYVGHGATFSPSSITNFFGRLINCGTSTLPSFNFDNNADTAKVLNYATMTLAGTYGSNQKNKWVNGFGAKLTFNNSLSLNNTNLANNGSVLMKGSFTINSGNNVLINHDSITVLGSLTINASLYNDGFLYSKGNMTLNTQGNLTNACLFETDKQFTFSGTDTLVVSGLIATSKTDINGAVFQGNAVRLTKSGFIEGVNFSNNGTRFFGDGNLYFTGMTINQGGTAGAFGVDGKGLNFYDSGMPGCPSNCRFFDTQSSPPHASVTKNAILLKDSIYVPSTCSSNIKRVISCVNKPYAGKDTSICVSKIDLADAKGTQAWYFLSGPQKTSIDPNNGIVSDLFVSGNYRYVLIDTVNQCSDTVAIQLVSQSSPFLYVRGDTICSNAQHATLILNGMVGASYSFILKGNKIKTGIVDSDELFITIPTSQLTVGVNEIVVETVHSSVCSVVQLNQTAVILVNADPSVLLKAVGDTVCSNSTFATVKVRGVPVGVNIQAFLSGTIAIGSPVTSTGGNLVISIPLSSLTFGINKIVVSATIVGCGVQTVKDSAYILVNKLPNASLLVLGDTVFENELFAYPSIKNADAGVTYQVFKGSTVIDVAKTGAGGNLPFLISVSSLSLGNNFLTFRASLMGCGTVPLFNSANVLVKSKVITSLEEAEMANSFRVWPNPVTSELHVQAPKQGEVVKVTIQDALGVVVFEKAFISSDISFTPMLTNGVYQLLVESGSYKHATKFVKQE